MNKLLTKIATTAIVTVGFPVVMTIVAVNLAGFFVTLSWEAGD